MKVIANFDKNYWEEQSRYFNFHEYEDEAKDCLLFVDDISPTEWKEMNDMWNALPYKKYDLTHVGHWSGTGVIVIGDKFDIKLDS